MTAGNAISRKIGYARTSTRDQCLDLQLSALRKAGCDAVVTEQLSGASMAKRPKLLALLDQLGEGDTLVVWKLDRLGRSIADLITIIDDLRARGIEFVSLSESIDTSTPGGKLIFHIFGALAEFERGLIRERTMAGLEAARARGRVGGRPRALDDEAVAHAAAMLRGDSSITVAQVAKRFGVSATTMYASLPGGRAALNGHSG